VQTRKRGSIGNSLEKGTNVRGLNFRGKIAEESTFQEGGDETRGVKDRREKSEGILRERGS